MEKAAAAWGPLPRTRIRTYFKKMYARPIYRLLLVLLGLPTALMVLVKHLVFSSSASYDKLRADLEAEFKANGLLEKLKAQALESERNKSKFLKRSVSDEQLKARADKVAKKKYDQALQEELTNRMRREKVHSPDMLSTYLEWLDNTAFFCKVHQRTPFHDDLRYDRRHRAGLYHFVSDPDGSGQKHSR